MFKKKIRMIKSIKSSKIQRDNRTPLWFKKAYLWINVIACIFAVIIAAIMFYLYSNFAQNNAAGIFFVIISVLLLLLSLVMILVNIIGIANENFMWMTTILSGGQCIGRDILDCNPDAFEKFEDDLKLSNLTHKQNFDSIYLSTIHPNFANL